MLGEFKAKKRIGGELVRVLFCGFFVFGKFENPDQNSKENHY
jgi:hypothetical protein